MFELTGFQRDIVYITAGMDQPSGQDIKEELEQELEEVTRGRLYPNLDTLVEQDYLEKGTIDRRTNYYALTDDGLQALRERRDWEDQYMSTEITA